MICISAWEFQLQTIAPDCFCNRSVRPNKVNDLEKTPVQISIRMHMFPLVPSFWIHLYSKHTRVGIPIIVGTFYQHNSYCS